MAYVRGNRLDGQQRVAQISQNDDQVSGPTPVLGSGQPPSVVEFDYPNPVRLAVRTHSTLYEPGVNAYAPVGAPQSPLVVGQNWPNPVVVTSRAALLDAGRSAFAPTPISGTIQPADLPNPVRRAVVQYESGANAFVAGQGATLTNQNEWANPSTRPVRQHEVGVSAVRPTAIPPVANECQQPVRRPLHRPSLYEPGANPIPPAPAVGQATTVQRHDWPNPMLRARRLHPAVTSMSDTYNKPLGGISRDVALTLGMPDSRWSLAMPNSRWTFDLPKL